MFVRFPVPKHTQIAKFQIFLFPNTRKKIAREQIFI
jgi:hypothetical protein